MFGFLSFVTFMIVIIVVASKSANKPRNSALVERNNQWVSFIASYRKLAKTKSDRALIDRMLSDIRAQGLADPSFSDIVMTESAESPTEEQAIVPVEDPMATVNSMPAKVTQAAQIVQEPDSGQPALPTDYSTKVDSISLLLYFGAFLFVASVGLFVAFADIGGWIRTFAVLLLALSIYAAGHWLYRSKPALQPAGLAFAGIGVVIMPLVGVAAHSYVDGISAQVTWFATSLLCLGLYLHAMFSLRKPLLNYIFIFTLLSLFESGVAVIQAPVYYFGWAFIGTGLLLQLVAKVKGIWPDFKDSSNAGSQLFVPLAIIVSLVVSPSQGAWQLGVSLLLASLYYGLESWSAVGKENSRRAYFNASHISILTGLACIVLSLSNSLSATGVFIAVFSTIQTAIIFIENNNQPLVKSFSTTILSATFIGILLTNNPRILTWLMIAYTFQALVIWWKQKRDGVFVVASLAWMSWPILIGKFGFTSSASMNTIAIASVISATVFGLFYYLIFKVKQAYFKGVLPTMLTINVLFMSLTILSADSKLLILSSISVLSILIAILASLDKTRAWSSLSGAIILLPVLAMWQDRLILPSLIIALVLNIILAVIFRSEVNRWLSAGLWLLLPLGLGGLTTSHNWATEHYAWAYVVAMLGLILSRAIARGVLMVSSSIPLASYTRNASMSYVCGYSLSGIIAILWSLYASNSRLHTTLILGAISLTVFLLAWVVEKLPNIVALQPIIWQSIALSIIRPGVGTSSLLMFYCVSIALGVSSYVLFRVLSSNEYSQKLVDQSSTMVALLTVLIAPVATLRYFTNLTWAAPLGVIATGVLLIDYWRHKSQEYLETAIFVMVLGVMWGMYYFGVTNIQAYAHTLAIMFAGFAWWRATKKDLAGSNTYVVVALITATVPLIVQSLSGAAGGLYGWWLLIEQVVFMVIGIAISNRIMVRWGLYVAVASVLYQLRHLGYLALGFLAIVIITVAVYQLQKYNKPEQKDLNG